MLSKSSYTISPELLHKAQESIDSLGFDFKLSLNKPTGDFFYDKWEIKDEYRNTIWEQVLNTLPINKGEARLIILNPQQCYSSHGDLDDRWHLNISGSKSYIVDLANEKMYQQKNDCTWYYMNAGPIHSAVNFGNRNRVQLVVRNLLNHCTIKDPITVEIRPNTERTDLRYVFDQEISPWLNKMAKTNLLDNFVNKDPIVSFTINKIHLAELKSITPEYFTINIL